jgi:hypothetical protein
MLFYSATSIKCVVKCLERVRGDFPMGIASINSSIPSGRRGRGNEISISKKYSNSRRVGLR